MKERKTTRGCIHPVRMYVFIQLELAAFLLTQAPGQQRNSGSLQSPSAISWVSSLLACLGHAE